MLIQLTNLSGAARGSLSFAAQQSQGSRSSFMLGIIASYSEPIQMATADVVRVT